MDIEKLRRIPLFADLHDRTLERIAELVLEEGIVEVQTPNGRSWELGAGEFFGELALLTDDPRKARVRSKTPVRCLAISRSDFQELLQEEPEIALAMLPRLVDALH